MENNLYFLFMTEAPIKAEDIEAISKLGCIVPYDPNFKDLATYGYYPYNLSTEATKQLKRLVKGLNLTQSEVKLDEIQRQAKKLQALNTIKQGDIVLHRDYKNLPFIVTMTDDKQSTIYHNLRHRPLVIVCNNEFLQVSNSTELKIYQVIKPVIEYKDQVILDCDIFNQKSIREYYKELFLTILRLKIAYISAKVILLNPFIIKGDIIDLIGFDSLKGNIMAIDNESPVISNSRIADFKNQMNVLQSGALKAPEYIVNKEVDINAYRYGLRENKRNIKDLLVRIKNGYAEPIHCVIEFDKECVKRPATPPRDRQKIISILKGIGLDFMVTRIHDIIYLMTGRELGFE